MPGDFQTGLHFLLTLITLTGVGVLIYFLVRDRKKIETAVQQADATFKSLQQFGSTAACLSCQLCNSTNPTISALVSASGICGANGCINTSGCPAPVSS